MEKGAIEILRKHGHLYMKDDYKELFDDLEKFYLKKPDVNEKRSCTGCEYYEKYLLNKCGFNCSFVTSETDIMNKFCGHYKKI